MCNQNNEHRLHVDGSFAMEFMGSGEDEHGLPLLEVNFYPLVAQGMIGDRWAVAVDSQHLVANFTEPLENAGLTLKDMDSLPLRGGWATISSGQASGFRVEDLESTFGSRAAVIILKALADALLSEAINADWHGTPYRSINITEENRYEEILAMQEEMQNRIEADESLQAMRDSFGLMMNREFTR